MRILLIDPPFYRFMGIQSRYYHMGLGYVAASLRANGHEIAIYSPDKAIIVSAPSYSKMHDYYNRYISQLNDINHHVWGEVREVLKKFKPDVVGITAMTPKIATVLKTASVCKEHNEKTPVVIGGPHATIKADEILQYKDVDYVIRGEGEISVVKLISAIRKNDRGLLRGVGGLSYRANGSVVHNSHMDSISDLNALPFPSRDLLLCPENYSSEDLGIIMTSRGCPFACTFCYKDMFGKTVRYRSIENVMEEIRHVVKEYDTKQFAFKDDSFTINKNRIFELCDSIHSCGIKINWECTTRVNLIDEDIIKKMVLCGCNTVKVGIESGSSNILKMMKKGITHEQVRNAACLFNKYGIFWSAYFMMGLPNETEEDIYKTLNFLNEIKPDYASIGIYEPYPGTELFELGKRLDLVNHSMTPEEYFDRSPDEYYLKNPKIRCNAISSERFEKICEEMLTKFDDYNKRYRRLFKRALARRKMYYYEPDSFVKDVKRALKWIKQS